MTEGKQNIFRLALIMILSTVFALANECTDGCDQQYTNGIEVRFCGTDYESHVSHYEAFETQCYDVCGVMTLYQNTCGCPNSCFSSLKQGTCEVERCSCSPGWSGLDCSIPSLENSCSLHGKLIAPEDNSSRFPFPYCLCDQGWTGTDCSTSTLPFDSTPWGTLFKGDVYAKDDEYEDDHPVWNISVMATVRVELSEDDYIALLQPWNLYNESYASATVYFDNGNVQETFENVGFRVKGASSRMNQKKGWMIKFNEFVSGQKLLDIKKLGFKAGSVSDDTLLKTMLYTDFSRAMGVPVQRASYALLYINSVFSGVYFMHEDIGPTFIESRLKGDEGSGNMMKLFYNVNLQYFGSDVSYYQTIAHVNELGVPLYYYEQTDGNGDWTDFIDWLYFFNSTSDEGFRNGLEERVHTESLLRQMVVESFMLASDNLASGANYYAYHREEPASEQRKKLLVRSDDALQWQIIEFDFDECFAFDSSSGEPEEEANIFTFFDKGPTDSDRNTLLYRMLSIAEYNETYAEYYSVFLDSVFGSDSRQQPQSRYSCYLQFLLPWIERDFLWQISFGMTPESFLASSELTISQLPLRYQDVQKQLAQK